MKNFFKKRGSQVSNHSNRSERTFFKQLIRSEELHEEIFQRLTVIYPFKNLFTSFQTNKFWPFHDYGPFFELEYTNPSYYKAVVQFILWEGLLALLKTLSFDKIRAENRPSSWLFAGSATPWTRIVWLGPIYTFSFTFSYPRGSFTSCSTSSDIGTVSSPLCLHPANYLIFRSPARD